MTIVQVVFLILAVAAIGSATGVVASKNIFYSALFLILCLFMVAGFYVLLEAPFLAAVQVLIYVGAIAVLIIFSLMLTEKLMSKEARAWNEQWWVAILVAACLAAVLLYVVVTANWQVSDAPTVPDAIVALGKTLMGTYVLPFEVASVLLLMALIGSIVIAREEKEEKE
jgi:NADH:ubiquinone oxidoreductase subunit 6 (subunit J)